MTSNKSNFLETSAYTFIEILSSIKIVGVIKDDLGHNKSIS